MELIKGTHYIEYTKNGTKVLEILDGVEEIPACQFKQFDMKKVILPKSLKRIEAFAFFECKDLHEIYIPDSVDYIGDPFTYNMGDNKISVPSNIYFDVIDIEKEKYEIRTDNKINYILDINALLKEERAKLETLRLLPEIIDENKKLDKNIRIDVGNILKATLITLLMNSDYNESSDLSIVLKILETKSFGLNNLEEQINQLFLKKQIQTIYLLMSYGYDFLNNCMISRAIIYSIPEMIEVLLILSADINEVGIFDMPPISIAAQKGYFGIVQYLIENGASINKEDSKGKKAIDYAEENDYTNIVELINSYNKTDDINAEQDIEGLRKLLIQGG